MFVEWWHTRAPPIFQNISTKTKWKSQNKHRQQQWWWLQYVDQAGLGRQHSSRQFNLRTNCKTKPNPLRPQPPITQIFLDGYDCSRCFLGVMTTRDSFQLKSPPPSTQKSKHCYLAKKNRHINHRQILIDDITPSGALFLFKVEIDLHLNKSTEHHHRWWHVFLPVHAFVQNIWGVDWWLRISNIINIIFLVKAKLSLSMISCYVSSSRF